MRSLLPYKPGCIFINGMSRSGKTHLVATMVTQRDKMFNPPANKVLLCYSVFQEKYEILKNNLKDDLILHEGLPTKDEISEFATMNKGPNIIILDDLQMQAVANSDILQLCTEGSHHLNLYVLICSHNLFMQGKCQKTMQINMNYIIIFEHPRDLSQLRTLGTQMFPGQVKQFMDIYKDATSSDYGYLVINLNPNLSQNDFRLYTKNLPGEEPIVYKIKTK
jgi:hypothetical protein